MLECNESDFIVTYPLNPPCGDIKTISYIEIHRKNIPKGLRKPYEYIIPTVKITEFINAANRIINEFNGNDRKSRCYVKRKGISRGMKLRVQLNPKIVSYGVFSNTSEEWMTVIENIQNTLFEYFGEDAKMYFRRMDDPTVTNKNRISAWWEAYIMFDELKNV